MTHQSGKSSRRNFLKLAGASLGAALTRFGSIPAAMGVMPQMTPNTNQVHLHTFDPALTNTSDAVRTAMLAATDLSWLNEGDSVFVKPASNSAYAPPAVTSPDVLEGVVRTLYEAGAGTVYVGDMSGAMYVRHLAEDGFGSTREIMRQNGLLAAAETTGATIHCFEEVPFEDAYIPVIPAGEHHWGEDLQVAEILDRVDHIVNLPRLGKHITAGATLGLKNSVGWISDYSRMVLHRDADTLHEKIAEINAIPQLAEKMRLTLTLVDKALTTYGPDSGYPLTLNRPLILASDDVVSHDQIALLTLLWARRRTPAEFLDADPYLTDGNGVNWWFVRTTWGQEAAAAYQTLPTFPDLADADIPMHINYAYEILQGGRPDVIEVVPGGIAPDDGLVAVLAGNPELNVVVSV